MLNIMLKYKAYIIIGPQGSGKGTQAKLLAKKYHLQVITTGELFRDQVKQKTKLADQLNSYMIKGELVPDRLVFEILNGKMKEIKKDATLIFDGIPRTINQAKEVDKMVELIRVISLVVPYEITVKRIAGRRICANGHEFNNYFAPPKHEGLCDVDNLSLSQREDDVEAIVAQRQKIYEEQISQVIEHYKRQGKIVSIDGDAPIEEVDRSITNKAFADAG
jgi:adenylate kinase